MCVQRLLPLTNPVSPQYRSADLPTPAKFTQRLRLAWIALLLFNPLLSAQAETTRYFNANGYTLVSPPGNDAKLKSFSSFIVRDGRFVAVGGEQLAELYADADAIDLQQQTVLPGLIDAHGHIMGLGMRLSQVDLRHSDSAEQAVARLAQFAQQHPQQRWLQGGGWNQENWPDKRFPTAAMIDEHVADRPVWLMRVDGHAGWANQAALAAAAIDADSIDPDGGEIVRDAQGQPTGVLIDNAMNLVKRVIPEPTEAEQQQALELAFQRLLSLGITSTHDAGVSAEQIARYQRLAAEQQLPMRIYAMIAATEPRLPELLAQGPIYTADDKLQVNSVKIYADGALGSRGAALLEPYSDAPHQHGLLVTPVEDIASLFELIIPYGFQVNIHAIGDRANRIALDQFASTFAEIGGQNLRNRVEHAQIVNKNDLARFKTLNIIASMQPTHATSDKNMAEHRLGKNRMVGAYAWQTFLQQGTIVAAGSDFPVEPANPFYGLHAAVTRQDRQNQPSGGWYAQQAMTLAQALRAFTLDAAYAGWQEQRLGSIEPGKWADFIVLDRDPFAIEPAQLWQVGVAQTYVAGERQYIRQHKQSSNNHE